MNTTMPTAPVSMINQKTGPPLLKITGSVMQLLYDWAREVQSTKLAKPRDSFREALALRTLIDNLRLAFSQVMNLALPVSTSCFRSSSKSLCHCNTAIEQNYPHASEWQRIFHLLFFHTSVSSRHATSRPTSRTVANAKSPQ